MSRHRARRTVRILRPQQHPAVKRPRKPGYKPYKANGQRRPDTYVLGQGKGACDGEDRGPEGTESRSTPRRVHALTFSAMAFYKEIVEIGEGNL
jgi:hypothetical protein